MKKIIIVALAIILCFSLTSCRKKKDTVIDTETQREYNITDWFSNDRPENGTEDGKEGMLEPEGITLPDHIW